MADKDTDLRHAIFELMRTKTRLAYGKHSIIYKRVPTEARAAFELQYEDYPQDYHTVKEYPATVGGLTDAIYDLLDSLGVDRDIR